MYGMDSGMGGYAATSYGGGYADNNAGGYHASPNGKGGSQNQNEEKGGASVQRLTPLLVSQIVKAVQQTKDDSFTVDGQELNQVTVVGTIKSVTKLSTNLTIVLADSTGEVDVRQWLDADDANADRFREGMMIRVIGHLREFQEKRSVLAFKIRVVEDPAEAEYHKQLCTYVHLYNTYGPLPDVADAAGHGAHAAPNAYQAPVPAYGGAGGGGGGGGGGYGGGLSELHKSVLNTIKNVKGGEGAALDDVVHTLRNLPQNQVREAIEYLSAEGHIYSTIDENHFRASN